MRYIIAMILVLCAAPCFAIAGINLYVSAGDTRARNLPAYGYTPDSPVIAVTYGKTKLVSTDTNFPDTMWVYGYSCTGDTSDYMQDYVTLSDQYVKFRGVSVGSDSPTFGSYSGYRSWSTPIFNYGSNFLTSGKKDGIITLDIETLMERYRKSQVKSDYFTEYLFYTLLQPEQVKFIESQLSQRKDLLVNTDARPVTYFLNLVLWDSLTGGRLHELFHGLKDMKLQWFLIPIVIVLAGRIIYVVLRQFKLNINQPASVEEFNPYYTTQLKTNCLIALATTGFTGIALEIVLLYAFQNIYGYIYERMGVIVAVFMVGLALGGYITNRIIQKRNFTWINVLMVFEGVVGLFALILPFIIYVLSFYSIAAELGLTFFIGISGVLTGLVFPLVNKIFMQSSRDMEISAGMTYSADHIGAILGAILTGVIFVPLLGVFGTCLILAALNMSSLVLIAFSVFLRKRIRGELL